MRKLLWLGVAASALTAAGIAIADGIGTKSIKSVTGTFSATTVSKSSTRTCTNADGTFVLTNATYTGTAVGDPTLTGPALLKVRSLINTTKNIGTVNGAVRIDTAGKDTVAKLNAVYSGGQLAGLVSGKAGSNLRLLGNFSAGFSAAGGFTGGKIGSSSGGAAVELQKGNCQPAKSKKEKATAIGTISAVSSTSITVAGVTCAVPTKLQAKVSTLMVGDRVEIRCESMNGTLTLVKVHKKK